MTPQEKAKLFKAIGYHEAPVDLSMPETFEAIKLNFGLKSFEISIHDDTKDNIRTIMNFSVKNAIANISQRPSANALQLVVGMKEISVSGINNGDNDEVPILVKSLVSNTNNLLDVFFETNPLDKLCDKRVRMTARPLKITYHAETVNELTGIFNVDGDLNLSEYVV